jgi:hypothetical protein
VGRWGDRLADLLPRRSRWRMRTRALTAPWEGFVVDALDAEDRYRAAVRRLDPGPLRDRLHSVADEVTVAVEETWRVASAGQDLSDARLQIDVGAILTGLEGPPGPATDARRRQLEVAKRIDQRLAATQRRLTELDAHLDEVVTRTLELGATQQVEAVAQIGSTVDDVVEALQALSTGLAELPDPPTDLPDPSRPRIGSGGESAATRTPPPEPGPPPAPPYEGPMPDDPQTDWRAPGPDERTMTNGDDAEPPSSGSGTDDATTTAPVDASPASPGTEDGVGHQADAS